MFDSLKYCKDLFEHVMFWPVRQLYARGPYPYFWEGASKPQICARITGVPEEFWNRNAAQCSEIIARKTDAFVASISVGVYSLFALLLLCFSVIFCALVLVKKIF